MNVPVMTPSHMPNFLAGLDAGSLRDDDDEFSFLAFFLSKHDEKSFALAPFFSSSPSLATSRMSGATRASASWVMDRWVEVSAGRCGAAQKVFS